jgi:hypothetical protein
MSCRKVAVVRWAADGSIEAKAFGKLKALKKFLEQEILDKGPISRLLVIAEVSKNVPAAENKIPIAALEEFLKEGISLPDEFIHDHLHGSAREQSVPRLHLKRSPSTRQIGVAFALDYFDLRRITPGDEEAIMFEESVTVTCDSSGRPIICHHEHSDEDAVLVCSRKVSFWSRTLDIEPPGEGQQLETAWQCKFGGSLQFNNPSNSR